MGPGTPTELVAVSDERRALSDRERLHWLRLSRAENVGPITFLALIERYGEASQALAALLGLARAGRRRKLMPISPLADIEREVETTMAAGAGAIALIELDYPLALTAIADPPPVIVFKGHAHLLREPVVGIVGARNASANGTHLTRQLASDSPPASSSHPAWRAASTRSARLRTRCRRSKSARSARSSPKRRSAPGHWRGIFLAATG